MNFRARYLIAASIGILAVGFYVGSVSSNERVLPTPIKNRSRIRWIGTAAKTALWFLMFVEEKPQPKEPTIYVHRHEPDDQTTVNHYRGW